MAKDLKVAEKPVMMQPVVKQGTSEMVIVPPKEIETFDVDVNEAPSIDTNRAVPIIRVLQSNSPQVADPRDGGIPGAKAGSFFNVVTREVFEARDLGLYLIPVRTHRIVIEYVKRETDGSGGGFLNAFEPENPIVIKAWERRREELHQDPGTPIFGKIPNGIVEDPDSPHKGKERELVDTWYIDSIFVLPNADGSYPGHFGANFRGSLTFQSTFIPVFNSWDERRKNQKYPIGGKMVEPALWTTIWRARTALKTKGTNKWMLPNLTLGAIDSETGVERRYQESRLARKMEDGSPNPLYIAATDFYTELQEGSARLDFSKDAADTAIQQTGDGEDIPFNQQ